MGQASIYAAWAAVIVSLLNVAYFVKVRRESVRRDELTALRQTDEKQWAALAGVRERVAAMPSGDSLRDMTATVARTDANVCAMSDKLNSVENHISLLLENELRGGEKK